MKHRVWRSYCLLIALVLLLTLAGTSFVLYDRFSDRLHDEVRREAQYAAACHDRTGEMYYPTGDAISRSTRITLIAADGTVKFDSMADAASMKNHADREEVAAALHSGTGEALRQSDTMSEQIFYCAVRLKNGDVLRVGGIMDSAWGAVWYALPYMALIAAAVIAMSMALAHVVTGRIVRPINTLNLDDPLSENTYEELSPLLRRLQQQNERIAEQQEALMKRQREFEDITGNMKEGLLVLNAEGKVLSVNNSARTIFSVQGDVTRQHVLTLNRSQELRELMEQALGGTAGERLLSLHGRQYSLMATPVMRDDTPDGMVMLVLDVTEKQEAERHRREFTANVSHELKTPLTAISGYAEIMENGLAKAEDTAAFAGRIHTEAGRLMKLVEDILHLSEYDETAGLSDTEPTDLTAICRGVTARLADKAAQKQVTIETKGEAAMVNGVPPMLEELAYNLCDNAITYNRRGGSVTVSVEQETDGVLLTVSDTGIGIPAESLPHLFERFYRVDKSRSKETGGTGLGLSIVRHIALLHGASVRVNSTADEGSCFFVRFLC